MVVDSDPGSDLLLASRAIWALELANNSWVVYPGGGGTPQYDLYRSVPRGYGFWRFSIIK